MRIPSHLKLHETKALGFPKLYHDLNVAADAAAGEAAEACGSPQGQVRETA